VTGLVAGYARATVLFDVSLEVGPGEVVALLGRNGAGKSTTLRAAMGLVTARAGRVRLHGVDVVGWPPYRIARRGLGYVPEDRRILTTLTVAENLAVGRQPPRPGAPLWTPERLGQLFPQLAPLLDRPAGRLSGGEQQMLTIARTLMGNPSCLLLDEPSEGLAPVVVDQLARTIAALKGEGLAMVLAEPNLRLAGAVSDRAFVIEKGRVAYAGAMATLERDADLRRRFLAV
jgi:branched-chain amino acid transport system ATP-binding protein